ncbi:MAG: hypothetical protein IKP55_06080, partial [Clostridia bacterium]|nr:hypothetical protein [Clostridia bacterium]
MKKTETSSPAGRDGGTFSSVVKKTGAAIAAGTKRTGKFLAGVLGFEKLTKYENDYLHDANIRSCSYMGFIVVLLELWMLIRQSYSKILPKYQ